MSWSVKTSLNTAGTFYKAVVARPAGYRRDCTTVTVTADHVHYQLLYVVDETQAAGEDTWELPIRFTDQGPREVDVDAMLLGGLLLSKERPVVKDGTM
jgi:hypothetical protein